MAFISAVHIRGFRSLANQELRDLEGLAALVGRNSSGKSNALRALSLFFTDQVEPGQPFNPDRDFYYRPGSKKKREIQITVEFDLPKEFKFRAGTDEIEARLGRQFVITRDWHLDRQRSVVTTTTASRGGLAVADGDQLAAQFLKFINFRYITNRVQPREVLALESKRLAAVLVRRIRQTRGADDFLKSLASTAGRFLKPADQALKGSGAPIADIEMSTARALGEMLQVGGLRATGRHGGSVEDEQWGSGHQALGLYEVLRLIDADYGTDFGWKQATLWLIEEPEAGLHEELQTYLGGEFSRWTEDRPSKHQILMTTHSAVFSMAATSGYWVEMDDDGATTLTKRPIHELVRDAQERGISPWTQPVLSYPDRTIVLVEGEIDADVLQHVADLRQQKEIRFLPLPRMDPAIPSGGADQIIAYLKKFGGLISHRRPTAPLIVLLDYDVSDKQLDDARKAYGTGAATRVIRADPIAADPSVTEDFTGIERFYPTSVLEAADAAHEIDLLRSKHNPLLRVRKKSFDSAKAALRARILRASDIDDVPELSRLIDQVRAAMA